LDIYIRKRIYLLDIVKLCKCNKMNSNPPKYKIKEFLENLPRKQSSRKTRMILNECGIAQSTLSRWINIPLNGKGQIGSQDLDRIALILDVTPDELKNYTVAISEPV